MNEIIYCGVKFCTDCSYYRFKIGDYPSIITDSIKGTVDITYKEGMNSSELCRFLSLECINDMEIRETKNFIHYHPVTITLNGLKFKKVIEERHVVNIILVEDHPSRVVQNYNKTTMVLNVDELKDPEFKEVLFSGLKYIRPSRKSDYKNYEFYNFPKIIIDNKSLDISSNNKYINKLRESHDIYLIKAIDYEHEFFRRLQGICEEFGLELTRVNREETLRTTSYISYSINQTPVKYVHVRSKTYQSDVMCHMVPIDYQLRTPDMVLYFDFKNRYNNVDLFTNFTEFYTQDRYGGNWLAAVKWGVLTEDFNQQYNVDDNSNFSYQCSFRSELYFYEIYDKNYNYIKQIIVELESAGMYEKK